MAVFDKKQAYLETNYHRIYEAFHRFLKVSLLRIFDDDFMVAPIPTALFYFHETVLAISLAVILLHIHRYGDNLDTVILGVSAFVSGLEVLIKITGMAYYREDIRRMINTLLHDRSYLSGPMEAAICGKYLRLARKLLVITILSYVTTGLMLLFYPIVAGELDEYKLPLAYSIPFVDYRQHPLYIMTYTFQFVQIYWVALVFIGLDGPFYLFVCYSASQLEILIVYLRQIGESPDNVEEQRRLIRKVFDVHGRLSEFLACCSRVYRDVYLVQVLCSIVHICVSMFHVQLKLKNGSYGMLLTNVNKMWLFCFCGELVVSKAAEFGAGVYANRWYQLWNRRDLRDILFMLRNAQRNYGFSIGGFGFLSFATFTAIMKTAYSCNAFLHQVMN